MSKAWARKTPSGFEFSVKIWQKFTHGRRIGDESGGGKDKWEAPAQADVDLFLKGIEPLLESGKLGVLLFQYPPGFHFTEENAERLRWTLQAFKGHPKVVELRHRSWSDRLEETKALLLELGASLVFIDEPKFGSSIRQEFKPVGTILYLRLHGRNRAKWWEHQEAWERYDYLYSQEEIRPFVDKMREVLKEFPGSRAYVFFNNHARGQAVANAIMLNHEMGTPIKTHPAEALLKAFPQISGMVPKPAPLAQKSLF